MSNRQWVIMTGAEAWTVWSVNGADMQAVDRMELREGEDQTAALIEALQQRDYNGEPVALALESAACVCAGIDTTDLPRRGAKQAMAYRFEEKLPLAAEQVVADFIVADDRAMGVCVVSEKWQGVIEALKAAEIAVELIAPAAMLALQGMSIEAEHDAVLLAEGRRIDLFVMQGGRPLGWHAIGTDDDELAAHLNMCGGAEGTKLRLALCGENTAELARRVQAIESIELVEGDHTPVDEAAARLADRALAGKDSAWVNLCRDELAAANPIGQLHAAVKMAIAAVLMLWVCTMGAMAWRSHQYQQMITQSESQQAEIYRGLYDKAPPLNVKSRLLSEHRSLAGVRQGGESTLPVTESVLPLLHKTLKALPPDQRFAITQLTLDDDEITLVGLAPSHTGAEALATAIGRGTGWRIEPPRTQRLTTGEINFTLRGSRSPAPGNPGSPGGSIAPIPGSEAQASRVNP